MNLIDHLDKNAQSLKLASSERGSVLVVLMVLCLTVTGLALVLPGYFINQSTQFKKVEAVRSLAQIKSNIDSLFSNPGSLANTTAVNNNSGSAACLGSLTPSSSSSALAACTNGSFLLKDVANNDVPLTYDFNGQPCTAVAGGSCPIALTLTWQRLSDPSPHTTATYFKVMGQLSVAQPPGGSPIKTTNFELTRSLQWHPSQFITTD